MEQPKAKKNLKIKPTSRVRISYPLPSFLAFNFKGFNFKFRAKPNHSNDKKIKEKLLSKYTGSNVILLFNGELLYKKLPKGVHVQEFRSHEKYFADYKLSRSYNLLTHLNKAYLNSGLNLRVAKTVQLTEPIKIIVAGSQNTSHYANYVIDDHAQVVIEEQFELFRNSKLNYIVNTVLHDQAKLKHVYVETLKTSVSKASSIAHNVTLGLNAALDLNYFNLNDAKVVHNTYVELLDIFARANVNSYTVANKDVRLASLITIKHLSPETTSNIHNVGIVNDEAQLNIDGLNVIEKGNAKSVADQESKIINLTDEARSIANPQLIINEYDVKAGHAASVGRIDEDQIYYLMSRGLTKTESKELLIMSYLNEGIEAISDKKLKQQVIKLIHKKIQ